jgi:hypothetical protein
MIRNWIIKWLFKDVTVPVRLQIDNIDEVITAIDNKRLVEQEQAQRKDNLENGGIG